MDRVERISKLANIELITLNNQKSDNFDTESFNDYVLLADWFREESQYRGRNFYSFQTQYLDYIREKYQTDYLGMNFVWHFTERQEFSAGTALVSIMFYPILPYYLYWQFKPLQELDYTFAVFDLKGGDLEFMESKSFPSKYRKDIINAHIYNSFNQLRRSKL